MTTDTALCVVTIWESDNGRILLRIESPNDVRRAWIAQDFWRTFPRHWQAIKRDRDDCISLPLAQRGPVEAWLERWARQGVEVRRR